MTEIDGYTFPEFDLVRLLRTVFELNEPERFAVFTDLDDVSKFKGLAYLDEAGYESQKHAYKTLVRGIEENLDALNATGVDFYGYTETGGSNLDLPDTVFTPEGEEIGLRDALRGHGIVLYMGKWSATAPITKLAKEMGFRGATMHGTNDRILATGLSVDYNEVSARAADSALAPAATDRVTSSGVASPGTSKSPEKTKRKRPVGSPPSSTRSTLAMLTPGAPEISSWSALRKLPLGSELPALGVSSSSKYRPPSLSSASK